MSQALRRGRRCRCTLFAATLPLSLLASDASAQTNGMWAVDVGASGGSWSVPSNWANNTVPDGGGTALFTTLPVFTSQPIAIIQDLPNVTLSGITFDTLHTYSLRSPGDALGNSITLVGPATVHSTFETPTATGSTTFGSLLQLPIAGSAGLVKTGPGTVTLFATNTYSGGTTVNGGVLVARQFGDACFGAAGASITMNGGTIRVANSPNGWITSRTINLLAGGGTFDITTTATSATWSGPVVGPGSVNKVGLRSLSIGSSTTYTGATNILSGSIALGGSGSIRNTSALNVRDTLLLDNANATNNDRISDTAPVTFMCANFTLLGFGAGTTSETIGDTTFTRGTTTFTLTGQRVSLSTGDVARHKGAAVFFRGNNLGATPANGVANVYFPSAPTLIGGGGAAGSKDIAIIPWAIGNTLNSATLSTATNSFCTYGANGVRPLDLATEYQGFFSGVTGNTNNVRLTAADNVSGPTSINSLIITGSGIISGNTASTLTIGSGAVMNVNTAQIAPPVNFGPAEGIVQAQSTITFNGIVSGTGGLTKQGGGTLVLANGTNNYTGTTTVGMGTLLFTQNIGSGTVSQLGMSTSPVQLASAGRGTLDLGVAPAGNTAGAARLIYGGGGGSTATFARDVLVTGRMALNNSQIAPGIGCLPNSNLVVNGNITLDDSPLAFVGSGFGAPASNVYVNGVISGNGGLIEGGATAIVLSGNNTFTGGVEMSFSNWLVGSDSAFGSGTIKTFSGTTVPTIIAFGGPRVVPNDAVSATSTGLFWIVGGSNDLTFTGNINLAGNLSHNITNTGVTTYAGVLHSGGLVKSGSGTLVLSGSNAYSGSTTISLGTLRVTHANALGSPQAPTYLFSGALELAGGALTSEPLTLVPNPTAGDHVVRNVSGNNSLADVTVNAVGTFDVVSGALSVGNVDGAPVVADLTKTGSGSWTARRFRLDELSINAGTASVALGRDATGKVSTVGTLAIAGGATPAATLDLGDNDLVTSAIDAATLAAQIRAARNGGAWDQTGITSTAARNQPDHATGLGLLTAAEYTAETGNAGFDGVALGAADAIVKYTWNGDSNLDGRVTFDDYVNVDVGFGTGLSGWLNGDFNYDGVVNFDDYVLIDVAFNAQNGTLGRAVDWISGDNRSGSGRTDFGELSRAATGVEEAIEHFDAFGLPYARAFLAAVPEPASISVVVVGIVTILRRIRRAT